MSSLNATSKVNPTSKQTYYLSVAAIFKNESHGIKEWIEHYISEGVDHFYLIDNGSTDGYQTEIVKFLEKGLITLVIDDTRWAQIELYNRHFLELKDESEWLLVCDLDEFIYGRNGYRTIVDFLKSLSINIGAIRIPWKMFGSSNFIDQPRSIVDSFLLREAYERGSIFSSLRSKKTHSKAIVRSKFLKRFHIHFCYLKGKCKTIGANQKRNSYPRRGINKSFQSISEKVLENSFLHLNHYALQSKKWFLEVKCTRGSADNSEHETFRDLAYFDSYNENSNEVEDDELAKKRRAN